MLELHRQIEEATAEIRRHWTRRPRVGIILGTGLSSLAEIIETEALLPYEKIPNFPCSTAVSHHGRLHLGTLAGVPVVAMAGRCHGYEGYKLRDATLPVRVMRALGADLLIVSNAAGGLNPYYKNGDVMVIDDHINLMHDNPLIGINDDRLGPRFPDMSCPYDPALIDRAQAIARREDFTAHRGVYIALTGPNLETRAEYRFLRRIGGDVVGMSTVPEVIVAVHCGLKVLAFSVISNVCLPDALRPVTIDEIVATANEGERKLRKIVLGILSDLPPLH
jgi:purine-nucleoside phosphorylase